MEKSNIEKIKDTLLYAPVGAYGFFRDNAPTFFSMFVSRGKRDVSKTTITAEEKISTTKEHGQFVAMGTPVLKTRAEQLAQDAKSKGEHVAHISVDIALGALGLFEGVVNTITSTITGTHHNTQNLNESLRNKKESEEDSSQNPAITLNRSGSIPPREDWAPRVPEASYEPASGLGGLVSSPNGTYHEGSISSENPEVSLSVDPLVEAEGSFIAEPVDPSLPDRIRAEYEVLSAPEIIDRLDEFSSIDLKNIRSYEQDFRNRQTIIHAINYRLGEKL